MAKRFTDTAIWQKEWFLKLSMKQKLLVKFLFDNCDCAGIYEPNFTLLSFFIGDTITEKDLIEIKQVKKLPNGNYMIEDFLKFQYGINNISELNSKFSVHKGIIKQLEKNNITLKQPLPNPYPTLTQGLQDKDMDKDKDKDINTNSISFDFFEKNIQDCFQIYKENCKNLIPLSFERRNRDILSLVATTLNELDNDVGKFTELCQKANELETIAEKKIDFKMMLRNYIGILNDKYKPQEELSILERLGRG